jgi:hypothetical protein
MNNDGIVYYNGSNLEDLSDLKEIIKNAKGLPEDKNKVICKLLDMVNPLN